MESVRRGLSGMDAAKAALGHGRPIAAGPWSTDGAKRSNSRRLARRASKAGNEPQVRSAWGRMSGAFSLCLLSLCANKEKVRRRARRNL